MFWKTLLESWYRYKLSPKKIAKHFKELGFEEVKDEHANNTGSFRVSCVQREIRPVKSIEEFIDMIHDFVRQGVAQGSKMIIFPEYNFFDLFGIIPGFHVINRQLRGGNENKGEQVHEQKKSDNSYLASLFEALSGPVQTALDSIVSHLARNYRIYIYTGSCVVKENGKLYNAGSLFGPDGSRVGMQKKLHLTDFEEEIGICRDTSLQVYPLPSGKFAFPVCMDATYFETFRAAGEKGADVVIMPIANMEEYSLWKSLRGIWPRVQEAYVYGLKSSLNGWIAGMHFTGKAGIFAPLAMTANRDGIIAISDHYEGDYVITADIDIERLHQARQAAEYYGDSNPEFEKGYVERTYQAFL